MKVSISILIFLVSIFTQAQEVNKTESVTIHIAITELSSDDGMVYIGLYDSEENFYKKRFKEAMSKIENGEAIVSLNQIPKGTYAISVFHDENSNRKLDTNFIGIPKEATGCSNNAKGFMSAPKWKDAKFNVDDQDISMTIKM